LLHVYPTNRGEVARLVSINDQPLSAAQVQAADHRIQTLISQPAQMRQHQKKQREDGEQARNLLRMFPDAFRFQYDGTRNGAPS
jgi:ribosomal protein S15P/S13E